MSDVDGINAVEILFREYAQDVYRFALFSTHAHEEAEDIVQDVFIKAIKSWKNFRQEAQPKTWLFVIAKNCIRDSLRKKRITTTGLNRLLPLANSESHSHLESLVEIMDSLKDLSIEERNVLYLRHVEDLQVNEIAEILGISRSKVYRLETKGTNELRRALSFGNGM
ncbi:RNA polymerase sigma factor [Alicyclobacillus acidoterrestris]|uniref:RNA polymerase sigma factor n=1 Tax=Alicyclobacillus acidoterrestris TaxID=1450 RepID=UPI003F53931F